MIDDSEKTHSLETGIFILTGGRCLSGNIIVSVPTNKLEDLSLQTTEKLSSYFHHVSAISKYLRQTGEGNAAVSQQPLPVVCLADLRQAPTLAIKQLTDCLDLVEHEQPGTVAAVYFLKPRSKTRSHILKKLLGLKPSKKRPRVPLFKVVLIKTLQELYTYIDASQLTADFCGTIRYNHVSWMHLYNVVIKCIEGCHQKLLTKLPSVKDKVDLLQEYETEGQTSGQVQQLLADLTEKFHVILSESSLPLFLTMSKQTLFLLDHPSSDNHLSLVHPKLVSELRSHLCGTYSELNQWNTELEDAWRLTEGRLTILIQVHRHKERAKQIERKICEHYHPLLREHPIVGKTLSQAELYRAHFTTTLYDPAKELLSQATEILEAVQRLKQDVASQTSSSVSRRGSTNSNCVISDQYVSDISKCLTTSIQPFTTQLQQLQQLYVSIHIFHLLFEKALIWYKKALKFIPESLLQRCTTESETSMPDMSLYNISPQLRESVVFMPPEWLGAVRVFLSRHPPPRQEHIDRIDDSIPRLVDRKMRSQARSLALRLKLLQRVLTCTRLPLKVVTAVLSWRSELFGPSQQEKSSSSHSTSVQSKDLTNVALTACQDSQSSKKITGKDHLRPQGNRAPEKPPRSKKLSSVDREAKARPSSTQFAASEESRGPERPVRKNSSKLTSLSKSVDFNFNSSSTDGSVFDYDKALIQAEAETGKTKVMPRKLRGSVKEAKTPAGQAGVKKTTWLDDQQLSDPSELLHVKSLPESLAKVLVKSPHDLQRNYRSEPGGKEPKTGNTENFEPANSLRDAIPDAEPDNDALSDHDTIKFSGQQQQEKGQTVSLSHSVVSPSSDERFIRTTYTPKQLSTNKKPAFRFSSGNIFEAAKSPTFDEGEESGTDYNVGTDPYDSVVKRIREISSSNLTNIEKLKRVSEILSMSTLNRDSSQKPLTSGTKTTKKSFSTVDLRETNDDTDGKGKGKHASLLNDSSGVSQNAKQAVKPVEAVQRMKKNLAKSMEELNVIASYSQKSKADACEKKSEVGAASFGGARYLSEFRTEPLHKKASKTYRETAESQNHITSELYNHPSSRARQLGQPFNWSDVESLNQDVSPSLSSQDPAFFSKQSPPSFLQSFPKTKDSGLSRITLSRFVPEDSVLDHDSCFPSDDKKLSATRPSSLNVFPSRNFISQSFLRPASSMIDLSTRHQSELNCDIQVDLEQDYMALEDLEILRTIQGDGLSNEFTEQSLHLNGSQCNDNPAEMMKDDLSRKELFNNNWTHYQSLASRKKDTSQKCVPEIKLTCLSEEWPGFSHQEAAGLPFGDINFERLTSEAEREYQSQEEVAESLWKTQKILEAEEARRFQQQSDPSLDEDDFLGAVGGLSHTTSLDNGYGSWASKLACSTSSESVEHDKGWWKLSTSSADYSAKFQRKSKVHNSENKADEDEIEALDVLHELPLIDKPLTDPDFY